MIVTSDFTHLPNPENLAFETFQRSAETATDSAPTHLALLEVIQNLGLTDVTIVLLQATSPLRSSETVKRAMSLFSGGNFDLVCSASEVENSFLKSGMIEDGGFVPLIDTETLFKPRQKLPNIYKFDGAVYVFNSDWLVNNQSLVSENIGVVISPENEVVDIDSKEDFHEAERRFNLRTCQK